MQSNTLTSLCIFIVIATLIHAIPVDNTPEGDPEITEAPVAKADPKIRSIKNAGTKKATINSVANIRPNEQRLRVSDEDKQMLAKAENMAQDAKETVAAARAAISRAEAEIKTATETYKRVQNDVKRIEDNLKNSGERSKMTGYYAGATQRNEPHGEGIKWYNDMIYSGTFRHGERHGTGVSLQPHTIYVGEWANGCKIKKGVEFNWSDGEEVYVGWFVNDTRHFYGISFWRTTIEFPSETYVGKWSIDVRHGKGCRIHETGEACVSEYRSGREMDSVVNFYNNGDIYVGNIHPNDGRTEGVMLYKDGSVKKLVYFGQEMISMVILR